MGHMWVRLWGLWGTVGEGRGRGEEENIGSSGHRGERGDSLKSINEKIKNLWKKLNRKSTADVIGNNVDDKDPNIDSGLGSESSSICLDQCEEAADSEIKKGQDERHLSLSSMSKLHNFKPSLIASSQSLFITPNTPLVSIIKPQSSPRVKIKKSISFCEHSSSQPKRRPVR